MFPKTRSYFTKLLSQKEGMVLLKPKIKIEKKKKKKRYEIIQLAKVTQIKFYKIWDSFVDFLYIHLFICIWDLPSFLSWSTGEVDVKPSRAWCIVFIKVYIPICVYLQPWNIEMIYIAMISVDCDTAITDRFLTVSYIENCSFLWDLVIRLGNWQTDNPSTYRLNTFIQILHAGWRGA